MTGQQLEDVTLRVSELFGPTWQGEGPHAGRRCHFLRLGMCNLSCEWCDTPFTWDRSRFDLDITCPPRSGIAVRDDLLPLDTEGAMLVVSGGEPLMHHRQLEVLTHALPLIEWHAESNGTIAPPAWWLSRFTHTTVSPKIGTRDPESKRIKLPALELWAEAAEQGRAAFKFVARDREEVLGAAALVERIGVRPDLVWIMPEGITAEDVIATHRFIAPAIEAAGFNTTTRLHTLLWNDERGR